MRDRIQPGEGRHLFANDVSAYDMGRPDYPPGIYEFIRTEANLKAGPVTLEVGAGNGLATKQLIELGCHPMTLLEPDTRFSDSLKSIAAKNMAVDIEIVHDTFEHWVNTRLDFDLVAMASTFHWLDPESRIGKIAACLKPGGYAALFWNVFGDSEREDLFSEATLPILDALGTSPSGAPGSVSFALDIQARRAEFLHHGLFSDPRYEIIKWTLELDTEKIGALYSTFSSISRLNQYARTRILEQVMNVAASKFGGQVLRNMISIAYVAERLK